MRCSIASWSMNTVRSTVSRLTKASVRHSWDGRRLPPVVVLLARPSPHVRSQCLPTITKVTRTYQWSCKSLITSITMDRTWHHEVHRLPRNYPRAQCLRFPWTNRNRSGFLPRRRACLYHHHRFPHLPARMGQVQSVARAPHLQTLLSRIVTFLPSIIRRVVVVVVEWGDVRCLRPRRLQCQTGRGSYARGSARMLLCKTGCGHRRLKGPERRRICPWLCGSSNDENERVLQV
jgi:hypothetical protein